MAATDVVTVSDFDADPLRSVAAVHVAAGWAVSVCDHDCLSVAATVTILAFDDYGLAVSSPMTVSALDHHRLAVSSMMAIIALDHDGLSVSSIVTAVTEIDAKRYGTAEKPVASVPVVAAAVAVAVAAGDDDGGATVPVVEIALIAAHVNRRGVYVRCVMRSVVVDTQRQVFDPTTDNRDQQDGRRQQSQIAFQHDPNLRQMSSYPNIRGVEFHDRCPDVLNLRCITHDTLSLLDAVGKSGVARFTRTDTPMLRLWPAFPQAKGWRHTRAGANVVFGTSQEARKISRSSQDPTGKPITLHDQPSIDGLNRSA